MKNTADVSLIVINTTCLDFNGLYILQNSLILVNGN